VRVFVELRPHPPPFAVDNGIPSRKKSIKSNFVGVRERYLLSLSRYAEVPSVTVVVCCTGV
jgi:hypothetical protein